MLMHKLRDDSWQYLFKDVSMLYHEQHDIDICDFFLNGFCIKFSSTHKSN